MVPPPKFLPLHRLTSLLGSCFRWLLVFIQILIPAPWQDLEIYGTNKQSFLCHVQLVVLPRGVQNSFPADLQHSKRSEWKGRAAVRAVPSYLGLGMRFCHSQSVSVLLFQAKSCICHMCGAHLNRLHSCLYCVFFGCFTKKHIHEHAKTKRHNLGEFSSPWCSSPSVLSLSMPGQ